MIVEFDKSFIKCVSKIVDKNLKLKIAGVILQAEEAKKLIDIKNLKKMSGFKAYYRIKLGDYRIGFELHENEAIRLVAFAHRKDIYNIFP